MPSRPKTHRQRSVGKMHRVDTPRPSAGLYNDRRWRKARMLWLMTHPLCVRCEAEGRTVAATVVDHIDPHRGDYERFWSSDNWQSLCKQCHDKKTAREDGAFGRKVSRQ